MIQKIKYSAFIPFALVIVLRVSVSEALDAEFGRIITYDNFDHFKVSVKKKSRIDGDSIGLQCTEYKIFFLSS